MNNREVKLLKNNMRGGVSVPKTTPSRYYIGGKIVELDSKEEQEKLRQRIRQYLELRQVSLLIGNGASIPAGAPVISSAVNVVDKILDSAHETLPEKSAVAFNFVKEVFLLDGKLGLEDFLGALYHLIAAREKANDPRVEMVFNKKFDINWIKDVESHLKQWLFNECSSFCNKATALNDHRELFRRLLLRSTSLPRLKIFTTNYDTLIEKTLDQLGIAYFDGFTGTIHRQFRSESYHYDLYFPGETTEGRINRVDRVAHLYKLHGSITWRRSRNQILMDMTKPSDEAGFSDVMIYPSPLKTGEMNGYPYSEMFRHFVYQIRQPQSVLFTLGYSLADDHINRLIYQALDIPSFTLVILLPDIGEKEDEKGANAEVWRLINMNSSRIIVITGGEWDDLFEEYTGGAGTLQGFVQDYLPDMEEIKVELKAKEEAEKMLRKFDSQHQAVPNCGGEEAK